MDASDVVVRDADVSDLPAVMNVLDGANLEADAEAIRERMVAGTALVATANDTVVGTLVFRRRDDAVHVESVAVRRRWRDWGIGTVLVEAAAARGSTVSTTFDPPVRPFYEALGFDVEPARDGRLCGRR